jgi:hypothetical protein
MPRRNSRRLGVLLWACAIAAAQPEAKQFANVSGVVVNSVTGQPILRAHVVLSAVDGTTEVYGAMTDAGGRFSILRMLPASYTVSVERIGHIRTFSGPMKLQAGDDKNDLKFSLTPAGLITGRVLDSDGEPVEGATVQVLGATQGNMTTDDRGEFRATDLGPGRYKVLARMGSLDFFLQDVYVDGSSDVHYAATYYPATLDARSAGRVVVKTGVETSGIDIRLVRSPMVRLRGIVTSLPDGVKLATVHLRPQNPGAEKVAAVKPDGKFEITGVDSGHYELYAATQDPKQLMESAPLELEVAQSDIKDLELRVMAPFTISGVVQYEDDLAKPAGRGQQHPRLWLQRAAETLIGMTQSGAEVKDDGTFTFEAVTPGRYAVGLSWQHAYVKSLQLGPTSMDGRILDVSYGAGGGPLSVLVSSALAEISGKVDGAADAANQFLVLARPAESGMPGLYTTVFGPDGAYRLSDLAPGKYKLGIAERQTVSTSTEIDDPIEITLSPGEKATKDLRVPVIQ